MSRVVAHLRIQHDHSTAEVSGSESPTLHLQAKEGYRDAQALREIGERPAELGIGKFGRIGGWVGLGVESSYGHHNKSLDGGGMHSDAGWSLVATKLVTDCWSRGALVPASEGKGALSGRQHW